MKNKFLISIKKIIIKLYNIDTTDYNVTGEFFNEEIANKYGLPVDFLPPELLTKHEFSESEYQDYIKYFPMHAYIWTNKAFNTSNPYAGILYRDTGDFQSRRYNLDEFSKTYAICINNKNIEAQKPKRKYLQYIKLW